MQVPLNDLARRGRTLAPEIAAATGRIAERGWYLHGPEVEAFEAELAAAVGAASCVGVANGTDALALALLGVGCAPGDEVLTAANAGGYTTTAALGAGLRPRYADVDDSTLCLSAETVERALTARTRAVVVTHLYGRLAPVAEIAALCRPRGVRVIEDCAQAHGAARDGIRAGAFGDAAAFSFYPTKNLGAAGDAGAVVSDDPEVAARVRRLAQYGWDPRYVVAQRGGRNSRLDEIQAAVLRLALPRLGADNDRRRDVCGRYARALENTAARLVVRPGEDCVCHLGVLRVDRRERAAERLASASIATSVHYPVPDHRQPAWAADHEGVELPVTEAAVETILTVPCFPELRDDEIDHVCEALHDL